MKLPLIYNDIPFHERKNVREEYLRRQNFKCWYCGNNVYQEPTEKVSKAKIHKPLFPDKFFDFPVHLHHNRKDGYTIGAVHAKCNAYLWQYEGR